MLAIRRCLLAAIAVLVLFGLSGCGLLIGHVVRQVEGEKRQEAEVVASLARYRQLSVAADAERLADMYDSGGELSHGDGPPHVGHDDILAFLKGYAGYRIRTYELQATSTSVEGDGRVTQEGRYSQTVVAPGGKTITAAGTFSARWAHQPDGRWLLRRMHTASP
ncbi:MAG: nuclear transport factor 2 family protein [Proteobacteria bacterium]|nr:nuclear transport factor 2 family protein [Pseudomonadota bacterium]